MHHRSLFSSLTHEAGPKVDTKTSTDALEGYPRSGTPIPISPDFSNLKSQWATLTPSSIKLSNYTAANQPVPSCPTSTVSGGAVEGDVLPPSLGQMLARAASLAIPSPSESMTILAASASGTGKGTVTGGQEIAGMGVDLVGVMLGFTVWL